METDNGEQAIVQQQGFWKLRHAVIAGAVLLLLIMAVRSCGGDADDAKVVESKSGDERPRQAIVVQIPAVPAPVGQPVYQAPVYAQPQPALPSVDPGNPWAVQQQPAAGAGRFNTGRQVQSRGWDRQQPPRPQYSQLPGSGQYRPLDEQPRKARENRSAAPVVPAAPAWPAAPYDRPAGSSFGDSSASNAYPGAYPGYYGAAPYMGPGGYGPRWPGGYGYGYPGTPGPAPWAW